MFLFNDTLDTFLLMVISNIEINILKTFSGILVGIDLRSTVHQAGVYTTWLLRQPHCLQTSCGCNNGAHCKYL